MIGLLFLGLAIPIAAWAWLFRELLRGVDARPPLRRPVRIRWTKIDPPVTITFLVDATHAVQGIRRAAFDMGVSMEHASRALARLAPLLEETNELELKLRKETR